MSKLFFEHVTPTALLPRAKLTKEEGRLPENWTRHEYTHSESRVTGAGPVVVHIFKCTKTHQTRVWGCE